MGRDIGSHTYGNTGGTIYQKIGITAGEYSGFLFRFIKVRYEIYRIFIDIGQHLHGNLGKPGLCITHGGRAVAVLGTEVSVSVNQRISCGPLLGHINQRPVNGAVAVGMVLTHGIADDTGALSVRLIRTVVQLYHGIQYPSLYRFQTISDVRKGTGGNNTHGIIYIRFFHGLLQIHLMDFIKNIVFHSLFS